MKKKELWLIIVLLVCLITLLFLITFIPGIELFSIAYWRLFVSITGPTLAFIAFIRTIQVQVLLNKKDDRNAIRTDFYDLMKLMNDYKKETEEVVINISDNVKDYYSSLNEFYYEGVYFRFERNINKIGPFFRCFHRIVKNLNTAYEEGALSHKEYRGYIGTLRTQFNSSELEFILYNSTIMHRGAGLGIELIGTSFFGDRSDILINQHMDYQKYFKNELLEMFIDNDSDNLLVKNRAIKRKKMRKTYQKIVNAINREKNEEKRRILVNRLTSTNFRRVENFFELTDEEVSNIS